MLLSCLLLGHSLFSLLSFLPQHPVWSVLLHVLYSAHLVPVLVHLPVQHLRTPWQCYLHSKLTELSCSYSLQQLQVAVRKHCNHSVQTENWF